MNIHKSCIIAVFLGSIFATQAYASDTLKSDPDSYDCRYLLVHVSNIILKQYTPLTSQLNVSDGAFLDLKVKSDEIVYIFEQLDFYGPNVTLAFERKTDRQVVKFRVQQNFCLFEAGSITVTPIRGQWVYRIKEGSRGNEYSGDVWLDQVSLNN